MSNTSRNEKYSPEESHFQIIAFIQSIKKKTNYN